MKKTKIDKSTVPISLSAKKSGTLKHQMLFTPYKIEWKNIPAPSVSQTSSRTFFNSMKNQLSNLKNDVQKLIKKENSKTDNKSTKAIVLDDNPHNKSSTSQKVYSSASKLHSSRQLQPQAQTGKFDEKMLAQLKNLEYVKAHQEQNSYNKGQNEKINKQIMEKQNQLENLQKQNRLQKNLICELKKQNHQLYLRTEKQDQLEQKLYILSEQHNRFILLQKQNANQKQQIQNLLDKNTQIQQTIQYWEQNTQKLKQKNYQLVLKLESQKANFATQKQQLKRSNQQIKTHNSYLQQKIQNLSEKMTVVTNKFKQKQFYIREMEAKLQAMRLSKKQYQIQQQSDKIKIIEDLQKQFEEKQKQIHQRHQKQFNKMQHSLKLKIQQLQIIYEEAQKQFKQETLSLKCKYRDFQQQISHLKNSQNTAHKNQIVDFKFLGIEFERKINQLVEENYGLKNKIVSLQSDIERINVEKGVLLDEIKLYQQIRQQNRTNEGIQSKWDQTIQQIHALKKEKEDLIQQYQFKIMKLENQLQAIKESKQKAVQNSQWGSTNFNKIMKEQLRQNQQIKDKLKQQLKQLSSAQLLIRQYQQKYAILCQQLNVAKIKQQLVQNGAKNYQAQLSNGQGQQYINKLKYELDLLKRKYQSLNQTIDSKNKQLKSKDQFIHKVLISKAGKKQEEDEILYVLNEVKIFSTNYVN